MSVPAMAETYDYYVKIVDNRGGKVTVTSGNSSVTTVTSEAGFYYVQEYSIITVEPDENFRLFDIRLFQNGSETDPKNILKKQNDNTYKLYVSRFCNYEVRVTFASINEHSITIHNDNTCGYYESKVKRDGSVIDTDNESPKAKEGDIIEIKFVPNKKYIISNIVINLIADRTVVYDESTDTYTLTFTMKDLDNVTVSPRYENKKYNINIASSEHGTVTANNSKTKWGESVTLTVTPENGYRLSSLTVMAGNTIITVSNYFTFVMPDSDVTVTAEFEKMPITYVDVSGNSHRATNVTSVTSDLERLGLPETETWYVVDSDVNYGSKLQIYGTVHLILADNIEFKIGGDYGIYMNGNSSLTIYSQSHGASQGKLTATGSNYSRVTNLTINGGQISFNGSAFGVYIASGGSMTVNNGYVTITSTANNSTAINDVNLFHVNGGTAIGNGNNIGKATPTVTAPKPNSLIYTASEQYLVTAGTTTHGKILYSTDGENYSEDIPKGIEAGTYTVYYKIDEGDTWFAVEPKTVSVSIRPAYTYVNADGEQQAYVEAEVVSRKNLGTRGHTSWYIVNEDVTFSDFMQISGTVNLILADGKELTVNNAESNYGIYISEDSSLNIYTQSHGDNKGKLTVSTEGHGISIYNNGSLTINGGLISITSTGYRHNGVNFSSDGSMTIRNGDVTILSEKYEAINDSSKLILTGGLLNSYGYGSQETIENTNYLDATGSQLSVNATVIKNGSQSIGTAEQMTWYVLKNDLSLPNGFEINGNVNIILADGVTMTINNTSDNCIYIPEEGSLSIYTQSHGDNKGKLTVSSGTKGIVIKKSSLIINGGLISITGNTNGVYFDTDGSMTIKNGDVTIVGQNDKAVNDMDKITKQGGNLTLKNYGLTVFGYLDASGVPQWHEAVELSNNNFNIGGGVDKTTWYVVKENLVFNTKVMIAGDVHLILEDGAEMTIDATSVDYGIYIPEESSLTIYSQSTGDNKGKLTAEAHTGIMISKSTSSLTINGGEITVFGGDNYESVCNYGTITINGGQNIFTSKSGTEGLKSYAGSTLTLGYNSVNDFIQIDGTYNVDTILGTINVKNGQTLTDGLNNAYNGTLNETHVTALSDRKLVPAYAVNIPKSKGGTVTADKNAFALNASGESVTLTVTPNTGYKFKSLVINNGAVSVTDNKDGTFTFVMPTEDVTITAVFEQMPITYIGADEKPVQTTDYTIIDENTTEWRGTMVAQGAVKIDTDVNLTGNTTLILCDDAELGLEAINGIYDFTIYCQSKGNGIITTGSTSHSSAGSLNIFGGGLIDFCYGINCGSGDVIIKDCQTDYSNDNGHGIGLTGGTITLGWNKPTTCISFSSYNGNVKLEKSFDIYNNYSDETSVASIDATGDNYLTDDQKAQIAGKYLRPAKCTVAVTPVDKDGKDVNIQGNWLNKYLIGTSVTLTAPAKEGYNFSGWYEGATEKCKTNSYTFTITENKDLTAVYEPLGKAELIIKGGDSFTINSETYNTILTKEYQLGSKITVETNGDKFAYWQNKYGMVLSRSKSYTYTVTGADEITAVFDTVDENKVNLVFESAYGQVMAREQLATGGTMNLPSLPFYNGYEVRGWDLNGNGVYDPEPANPDPDVEYDTIAVAIKRGLEAESKKIVIKPIYVLKPNTFTINVVNGNGGGSFKQNDKVTVVADTPAANMKFSHWTDGTNILCYNSRFTFFADRNLTLTAVYVAENDVVKAKAMTEIIQKYSEGNNLVFVSLSTVPEDFKIVKAGVILTNDADIVNKDKFDDKNATYIFGDAWSGTTYRYTLTKSNVANGDTWYARGYLIYTDKDGNTDTIYSAVESQTYSGN